MAAATSALAFSGSIPPIRYRFILTRTSFLIATKSFSNSPPRSHGSPGAPAGRAGSCLGLALPPMAMPAIPPTCASLRKAALPSRQVKERSALRGSQRAENCFSFSLSDERAGTHFLGASLQKRLRRCDIRGTIELQWLVDAFERAIHQGRCLAQRGLRVGKIDADHLIRTQRVEDAAIHGRERGFVPLAGELRAVIQLECLLGGGGGCAAH